MAATHSGTASQPASAPAIPPFPVHRFTVTDYERIATSGALGEDDNVELIEGFIVEKAVINPSHATCVSRLQRAFGLGQPGHWHLRSQSPVTTGDSVPEPDIAIVAGDVEDFENRHPAPDDLLLVVEVSATSLQTDRGDKARVYARAGIPHYWIVNLVDRQVETFTDPDPAAAVWNTRRTLSAGPIDLPMPDGNSLTIDAASVLPPAP